MHPFRRLDRLQGKETKIMRHAFPGTPEDGR